MSRDNKDLTLIKEWFDLHNPFGEDGQHLKSLSTGLIAYKATFPALKTLALRFLIFISTSPDILDSGDVTDDVIVLFLNLIGLSVTYFNVLVQSLNRLQYAV